MELTDHEIQAEGIADVNEECERQAAERPSRSKVYCENESHRNGPHAERDDCTWPHYVGPAGPEPIVGHPLTVHD